LVPIGRPVVINAVLRRLALTADGATLVTSSTPDRSYPVGAFHLRRWNIATGQQRGRTVTVSGFSGTGPQITPDGRVARVDTSSSVQIGAIHVSDGSLLGGPWSRGRRVRADWARNGRHLLTHQLGSTAELWNVADLKIVDGADRFIRAAQAALSPTGTKVVVIGVDASAAVHQRSGRLLATLPFEGVVSVTWCTDDVIALMTTKLRIHLWDTGQQAERFSVLAPSKGKLVSIAGGSALLVTDADDSVTRRLVLTGHSRVLKALRGASGGLSFSALSDIFTVDGEKAVQVWDAASGKRVATLKGSTGKGVAALSPDGTFALLEGDEGALEYWNMRTRARQVALPATLVRDAAISASGRQIAVAGIDGLVRVWDGSGRDIGSVQWESMPHGVRFTPDESALVVVSASRVSRVTSDSSGVQKVASGTRRLFGAWEKPTCVFMNGAGTKMVLLSGVLGHKRANLLDFTSAGDRQIKGRPSSLLAAWQKTTALAIAGDEVVPTDIARAPVAEANRKARQKRQRADELEVEDVF
jgi:WD40 repeat protein